MKNPSIYLLILFTSFMFAQKDNSTTINFKDGSSKQFEKVKFKYDTDDFIVGMKAETTNNENVDFSVNEILDLKKGDINYRTKTYQEHTYLFEEVIIGSLSVYKSGSHYFLENEEYGLREILEVVNNGKTLNRFDYGTLSLYVSKCKAAQELAYNKNQAISFSILKSVVDIYNTCSLSEDIQLPSYVITQANEPKDFVEIAVNVGYNLLTTDFNNISPGVSNSFGTPVIGAQLYMNNNMLKGSLGFIAMIDYSFPEEFNSSSNDIYLKTNTSYLLTMLGIRYSFNNLSKTFRPYLGVNGGFIFNSMSSVTTQNNIVGSLVYNYDTKNELAYNLNAGTYLTFGKQKFDFNVMYLPEMEFGLVTIANLSNIANYYSVSGFQLKVSYIF